MPPANAAEDATMPNPARLCATAAVLSLLAAGPGWAMGGCSGTFSASALKPLPQPLVLGLTVFDDSPRNAQLAAQFRAGLTAAGVTLGGAPNAKLSVNVSITGGGDGGGSAPSQPLNQSFSWLNGGLDRQAPQESELGSLSFDPATPMALFLRAEVRAGGSDWPAWVGLLNCSMQGGDQRQMAYDIGATLGGAIGQEVPQRPF